MLEFLINDRLSFVRFLGLGLEDRVPDARTIRLFREKLTKLCVREGRARQRHPCLRRRPHILE